MLENGLFFVRMFEILKALTKKTHLDVFSYLIRNLLP